MNSTLPGLLEFASSLPKRYERYVLINAPSLGYVEGGLRGLLFLAPGCRDSELLLELGYSILGFLSLYHDVIVLRYLKRTKQNEKWATNPVNNNENIIICLSLLQNTELLVEIASLHKWGEKGRWIAVVIIELVKMALRFVLYRRTKSGTLYQQKIPDRSETVTPENIEEFNAENVQRREAEALHIGRRSEQFSTTKNKKLSSDTYSELEAKAQPRPTLLETYKVSAGRAGLVTLQSQPGAIMQGRSRNVVLGEYLYMLRPALYLLAMYMCGRKSWLPWLLSLGLDMSGMWYSSSAQELSGKDSEELSRRRFQWCYYLLRSPVFEALFKNGLLGKLVEHFKSGSSILSAAGSFIDYVETYRNFYFYINHS